MGTRVNPDTIGYVWTGEYDLNTLRVDGEILESGTKKLPIRKYPDTCGRGLRNTKEREGTSITGKSLDSAKNFSLTVSVVPSNTL